MLIATLFILSATTIIVLASGAFNGEGEAPETTFVRTTPAPVVSDAPTATYIPLRELVPEEPETPEETEPERPKYRDDIVSEGRLLAYDLQEIMQDYPDYFDIANKAGVVSGCETYDGYVRFFSKRIPEANIQATVILFSKGGGSGGSVGAGQGLKFDDEGNLAVHIGDGLAFDKNEALTVSKETVMTSDDLVDESDVNQAVEDIFNGDGT